MSNGQAIGQKILTIKVRGNWYTSAAAEYIIT